MAVTGGGNRSIVRAKIGEEEVECRIDSAADYNIMREDIFTRIIGQPGVSELAMDKTVLKGAGGAYFQSQGVVTANTTLNMTEYRLDYKVLSQEVIPVPVLLGDPLLDKARVILDRKGAVVEPVVGEEYILLLEKEQAQDIDFSLIPVEFRDKPEG